MSKDSLRGFAGGLIIAAALFAVFYYQVFHIPNKTAAASINQSSVNKYLSNNKQVAVNKNDYAAMKDAIKQANAKANSQSSNNKTSSDTKKSNTTGSTPQSSSKNSSSNSKVYQADITIKSGMSSAEVSSQLKNKNIIKDDNNFNNYLESHQLMRYVQIGTFHVSSDMSFAQLANVITRGHHG